ncbi:pyridoxal-phosphate dependent enzyme [Nocardia huaxiensis]|uniref:Pyridoxal-phosphate dependent enzyme n=1 Tax=Nocardia huaxiensis TaxID=2755382 RepID=A0A7D6ZL90_9NOCA|nr:pyridoxal-phosphate dependent enzyme [Nocardia huaxiensis]QLY33347.1 pyridoxal-phosphate dependent enzyme [Nocardia huaxiensis]
MGSRTPVFDDVTAASRRIAGTVRPLTVIDADADLAPAGSIGLALEFLQHTGSFKARGAANLVAALLETGGMPPAGLVSATEGNAAIGFAWAARRFGVPVTAFLSRSAPPAKAERLRDLGAEVRVTGATKAEAQHAARRFREDTGAIDAFVHDDVLTSAGAGTILLELAALRPDLDTVICAVGAGGMFSGIAAVAEKLSIRVVGAEPEGSQALHAALAADAVQEVEIDSIASDSLGAPRVSPAALAWAKTTGARSVVVDDAAIIDARLQLWRRHRLAVEHGSATALAALLTGAYRPQPGERIGIVLCGANTDPADLTR